MDRGWIKEHAYQITRMLSGGIEVIGFYYFGTTEEITRYQGMFQTIMIVLANMKSSVAKNCTKRMKEDEDVYDFIMLTIESNTKKYSTTTYKIQNNKVQSSKQSEFGFQDLTNILLFTANWPLCLEFLVGKNSLKSQFEKNLEKEYQKIDQAICLLDGQLVTKENYEQKYSKKGDKGKESNSKTKKKGKITTNDQEIILENRVQFYASGFDSIGVSISLDDTDKYSGVLMMSGSIEGRAYIIADSKPTFHQIMMTLKLDIMSSLSGRCALWYEDLEQQPQNGTTLHSVHTSPSFDFGVLSDQTWALPRRVFVEFNETNLFLSDYVLPLEEEGDYLKAIQERCSELLQLGNIKKDQIIQSEQPLQGSLRGSMVKLTKDQSKKNIQTSENNKKREQKNPEKQQTSSPPSRNLLVLAIFGAFLVIFVGWLLMK